MNKKLAFTLLFLCSIFTSYGQTKVIISQYIETNLGTTPKGIEIFNVTGADIIFSATNNLQVYQGTNGGTCVSKVNITSGTLKVNEVWVIGTSDLISYATTNGIALSGTTTFGFAFNGDDALQVYLAGTLQDSFGTCGSDPGSSWSGNAVSTKDNNLQVKDGLCNGDISGWIDPSIRFTQIAYDVTTITMTGFGNAPASCTASPSISVSTNGLAGLDYIVGSGPSAEQIFTASGTNLTANIILTAPTNFEISTTSGSGFSGSVTLSQSAGVVASTTIYVRLKSGLAINGYLGDVTAASTGATTEIVSLDGSVLCIASHTITSFAPTSGPVGTYVTITGTGFSVGTLVSFDGIPAIVTYVNSTTLIAEVPFGATSYFISVSEGGCSINSTSNFIVLIDNNCISGGIPAGFTDLMFTGIYDDFISSCHYFELFNPTGVDIDLSNYTIGFDNNFVLGSTPPTSGFSGLSINLSGIVAAESTFMIRVSFGGPCNSCPTIVPDLSFENNSGINFDDRLVLFNNVTSVVKDVWQNHTTPGIGFDKGYIFKRKVTATAPTSLFNLADWDYNATEDCFGFAISSTVLPNITTQPSDAASCSSVALTVVATAGSGGALTYQWKYNDGTAVGWSNVLNSSFSPGIVSGETSNNLTISGFNVDGYQFYCEVAENGSCAVSSDAAQVSTQSTTWDGSAWSNGAPHIGIVVTLNNNYTTSTNGSFSACSLVVNAGFTLTVNNSTYVEVENNVTVDGDIIVETQGSFVQNNDLGTFTVNSGGNASVQKLTAPVNAWYEYTYWSSPVVGETIGNSLATSAGRYWFNAQNYLDATQETGNNNATVAGQDDIDDNGNDWQFASSASVMIPGVGYAATQSTASFTGLNSQYAYTFSGSFNTRVITTPVYRNDTETNDTNWNFIGNPFPSAINLDTFLSTNLYNSSTNPSGSLDGAIYLWSQNVAPSTVNNGNENSNFDQVDYAIINGTGETAGGDNNGDGIVNTSDKPNRFIPSGQGFFVALTDAKSPGSGAPIYSENVVFNNAMRIKTNNSQFFKNSTKKERKFNKIWVNLSSNNGIFSQVLVGYVNGATNLNDGFYYDAPRNLSTGSAAILYSLIEENSSNLKLAIQGMDYLVNL